MKESSVILCSCGKTVRLTDDTTHTHGYCSRCGKRIFTRKTLQKLVMIKLRGM